MLQWPTLQVKPWKLWKPWKPACSTFQSASNAICRRGSTSLLVGACQLLGTNGGNGLLDRPSLFTALQPCPMDGTKVTFLVATRQKPSVPSYGMACNSAAHTSPAAVASYRLYIQARHASLLLHHQPYSTCRCASPLSPCTLASLPQACIFFICPLPVAGLLRPVSVQAGGAASFEPGRPKAASHRLCAYQPQSLRPSGLCQCYAVAQAFWERPSLVSLPPSGIPVSPVASMQYTPLNLWHCVQV